MDTSEHRRGSATLEPYVARPPNDWDWMLFDLLPSFCRLDLELGLCGDGGIYGRRIQDSS